MTSQIVLITGANQGLGFNAAKQISKLPGWTILLGSRDAKRGQEAADKIKADGAVSEVVPVQIDVSQDASIEALAKLLEEKYGRLDALVNNAGALFEFDQSKTLRERLHATYEVNVLGAHILTEALKPLLEKAEFPRIVNISSYLGSNGYILTPNQKYPFFAAPVYNTSKTALNGLTAHYALTFPKSRTISLCPGYNSTNLNGFDAGGHSPEIGAKGIVRAVVEGQDSEIKTAQFWNSDGIQLPW